MMKNVIILISLLLIFSSCGKIVEKPSDIDVTEKDIKPTIIKSQVDYEGTYSDYDGTEKGSYFQSLTIKKKEDFHKYNIAFTASPIMGEPGCKFAREGVVINDTLFVGIPEWETPTQMILVKKKNNSIEVFTKEFDHRFALMSFCKGGSTLAGEYLQKDVLK